MEQIEDTYPASGVHHIVMNIDDAATEIHTDVYSHGFWNEAEHTTNILQNINTQLSDKYEIDLKISKLGLVMSEVAEAIEAVRKRSMDDKITDMSGEVVELADTVIRILDYCGKYNLCLGEAIAKKLEYNSTRPYKHGKLA